MVAILRGWPMMFLPLGQHWYLAAGAIRGDFIWVLFMDTILIVDDEVTTRDTLTELLERDGREIVTAGDGKEALELLAKVPRPCLIVLDLMMPGMDGWKFLQRQSADPSI